ncbi:hypothetical protein EC99P1_00067 [Enterococcus phage EC99P1]|nr:hypothetical protein EC99P1_00067 [Enterococcus phage EC99P1]
MFDELELLKYLIERRIERLGIDALYADEVELDRITAIQQALEEVITDVVEAVQDLSYEEETTIYTPFGEPMMTNLPHITTATGRDMAEFFRERRIPFE